MYYVLDLRLRIGTPLSGNRGGPHLLMQDIWCVAHASHHAKAARIRDCCGQLRTRCNVHPWGRGVRNAALALGLAWDG